MNNWVNPGIKQMKATHHYFKKFNLALCVAAGLSMFSAGAEPTSSEENMDTVLSASVPVSPAHKIAATKPYRPVAAVSSELAQVVVYYPQGSIPATVYVDRELQSVLLPGEFTVFCVAPGAHAIESYFNDQPTYQGKQNPMQQLSTSGSQTYFVQVNPGTSGNTAALEKRPQAESLLSNLHTQYRIINRASQVKKCEYINSNGAILIQEQVLFRFAASNAAGIFPESRAKLDNVVKFIRQANNVSEIKLMGYTDAIGSRKANQRLSEARADTVRLLLINQGISPKLINNTVGMGVAQSAEGCGTSVAQQADGCNVNSRRVEIVVRSH
jgi:OOP family OmpA-OmpF porin